MKLVQYIERSLGFVKQNIFSLLGAKKIQDEMYNNRHFTRTQESERIIWVDMEMTGLDPETCHILEVACIITDQHLNTIAEGPNLILHQPDSILLKMNEWSWKHHSQSGLLNASRESKITLEDAENQLMNFVKKFTPPGRCPLGGSSVYMDKLFLLKYMPTFANYMHYRIIDVSTVKELARRWYSIEGPKKLMKHRALEDIKESINELKYYKRCLFR
uniref:Probable oligoribonuclease n=1 Tax=Triatoma dimidiata TaxID=72491 RepID=A0A0V0GD70_TRIDM